MEGFYKRLTNVNDYRDGTSFLLNKYPETALLQGNGYAAGGELYLKKNTGRLTGWLSYTYSRTLFKVRGNHAGETINAGRYYPANYDKPHLVNLAATWKAGPRVSLSSSLVFNSGRPITYPEAKIYIGNRIVPYYTTRNDSRIPDYFRWDIGLTISGAKKEGKRFESDWNFSLYNVLGRRNAYSVYVRTPTRYAEYYNRVDIYRLSILGSVIPAVTFNFKF